MICPSRQVMKPPPRHESHTKQCPPCQPMPTRSPVRHGRTPGPTRSTTAATSCPGTRGSLSPGNAPPCTKRSLWQIPQARTRSSTCPAPGSGTSRFTSSSAAFAAGNCATVMVVMRVNVPRRRAHARGPPMAARHRPPTHSGRNTPPALCQPPPRPGGVRWTSGSDGESGGRSYGRRVPGTRRRRSRPRRASRGRATWRRPPCAPSGSGTGRRQSSLRGVPWSSSPTTRRSPPSISAPPRARASSATASPRSST